jgi:hypothetical protein
MVGFRVRVRVSVGHYFYKFQPNCLYHILCSVTPIPNLSLTPTLNSSCIGPAVAPIESDNQEPPLSLLSGQPYSDVISGKPSYPSDPIVHDSGESTQKGSNPSPNSPMLRQANSPYIIGFYDAYIDPEYGAVSLVLEYMNGGSIQRTLSSGKRVSVRL